MIVKDLEVGKRSNDCGYVWFSIELPCESIHVHVLGSDKPKEVCKSATHSTLNVFKSDTIIPIYHVEFDGTRIVELRSPDARRIYKALENKYTQIQGQIYASKINRLKATLGLQ